MYFFNRRGITKPADGVNFTINEGVTLGLVGEFVQLGSGGVGGSIVDLGGVNPVDLALQAAADRGDALPVFGRTRLLDVTPMMVIPGLDPEKAASISPEELVEQRSG